MSQPDVLRAEFAPPDTRTSLAMVLDPYESEGFVFHKSGDKLILNIWNHQHWVNSMYLIPAEAIDSLKEFLNSDAKP